MPEKKKIHSGRGTSAVRSYLPRKIIAMIVKSDKVQTASEAIKKSISGESNMSYTLLRTPMFISDHAFVK